MKAALLSAAFLFVATACATRDTPPYGKAGVEDWARARGLAPVPLRAERFELFALARPSQGTETLSI